MQRQSLRSQKDNDNTINVVDRQYLAGDDLRRCCDGKRTAPVETNLIGEASLSAETLS